MNTPHVGWRTRYLFVCLALIALGGGAHAEEDSAETTWAGDAMPWHNSNFMDIQDLEVEVSVWKQGVTGAINNSTGLVTGTLLYSVDGAGYEEIPMSFFGFQSQDNDKYTATIPAAVLANAWSYVDVTAIFEHEDDTWELWGDGAGNPAPLRYHFRQLTPFDVNVTFLLRMEPKDNVESPTCVVGGVNNVFGAGHEVLTNWEKGVKMTRIRKNLYRAKVKFPAGSYPIVWFKYKRDICYEYEGIPNRSFVLPEDGTRWLRLETHHWNTRAEEDDEGGWGGWGW